MDLHPLATSQKQLTDALNATLITYNGNEMLLQNDMGNTLILDSKTGHIMGLSEGFVPVGLKEHGGIMYIASVNKDGVGELGTIPSPILTLSLKNIELSDETTNLVDNNGPLLNIVPITDFKVYPGEKFLPLLNIELGLPSSPPLLFEVYKPVVGGSILLSVYNNRKLVSAAGKHDGLYQLKLYSMYDGNQVELPQIYNQAIEPTEQGTGSIIKNPYWFVAADYFTSIDAEKTYLNKLFKTYPGNIPPGKLGIKAELETIDYFGLIKITQMVGSKQKDTIAPVIQKVSGASEYNILFPGFEYKTESIRFVGGLEVEVRESYSGDIKYSGSFANKPVPSVPPIPFTTVQKSQGIYQILHDLWKKTVIYPKSNLIVDDTELGDYFEPLFVIKDVPELNTWFTLIVKYYDLFGGYINTYQFSFNPYHILNYSESYYNQTWVGNIPYPQAWPLGTEASWSPTVIPSNSGSPSHTTPMSRSSASLSDYYSDYDGSSRYYENVIIPFGTSTSTDFYTRAWEVSSAEGYSYLWSGSYYINAEVANAKIGAQFTYEENKDFDIDGDPGIDFAFTLPGLKSNYPTFNTELKVNTSIQYLTFNGTSGTANEYYFYWEQKPLSIQIPISESKVSLDCAFGSESVLDIFLEIERLDISTTNVNDTFNNLNYSGNGNITINVTPPTLTPDPSFTFPNPTYSLITSFTLQGDTDEYTNLQLGLNRKGDAVKAWSFENNLLGTQISKVTGSAGPSSFENLCVYFPETGTLASPLILDKGVYLINVDHMIQGSTPTFKFEIAGTEYDIIKFSSPEGEWFAPTLINLPERCQFDISWSNIEKLQHIGLYKIIDDVLMKDGSNFNESSAIEVKYYQSDEFLEDTEMILPLEATYFEDVTCLGERFNYYPGVSDGYYCNRHAALADIDLTTSPCPVTQFKSFVYTYDATTDSTTAVLPSLGGVNNKLTYRITN